MASVKETAVEIVAAPRGGSVPAPAGRGGQPLQIPNYSAPYQPRALRPRPSFRDRFRFGTKGSMLLFVGLPTLLTAFYYFVIATPQYFSETTFVVHSSSQQSIMGLGSILRSTIGGASQEPSYAVVEFIKSRDALNRLEKDVDFSKMLARPEADFLSRFPNPVSGNTQEDLYDAYQSFVSPIYDQSTGVTTLSVRSFRPEDSRKIATSLLASSEDLINRMNDRSRSDAVALAARDVELAKQKVEQLQLAVTEYQIKEGVLDPTASAKGVVTILAGLTSDLAQTNAAIGQAQALSPQSPQIRSLQSRAAAIQQQIDLQKASVLGADGHVAESTAQFQRLVTDQEFAEKELAAANASLDVARSDSARKQVYLERISDPSLADRSRYPRRLISTLTLFTVVFIVYAILWLLMANVREHAS